MNLQGFEDIFFGGWAIRLQSGRERLQEPRSLMTGATSNVNQRLDSRQRRIWEIVSQSPAESLWNLQGVPVRAVASRILKAVYADRLPGHAAETIGVHSFQD